jgi:hypothetical protein
MAHTYSIDHTETTTESVNVQVAAKSELTLESTEKVGDATISIYRLASGDNKYPANVTYRVENQRRGGAPVRRISVQFDTWAVDDDGAELVIRKPIFAEFVSVVPADLTVELADWNVMIGNLISFLYPDVTAGTRSTAYMQKLLFGLPQVV